MQLRLTVYGNGWQAVLPVYGNGCATMSYSLCNHVLQLVQPCLTVYGNGFRSGTSENQRLHTELGNSESEKESLKQKVEELRSQLETERADREEIETKFSELKQISATAATLSEKLTPDAATILSQLRARRKKSKTNLTDLEAILEILES